MGSVITLILSYNEYKKHQDSQKIFFDEDKELKENMPFLSSTYNKSKDL